MISRKQEIAANRKTCLAGDLGGEKLTTRPALIHLARKDVKKRRVKPASELRVSRKGMRDKTAVHSRGKLGDHPDRLPRMTSEK